MKICGITRPADARAAVRAGAHAIGFVFWKGSPRRITPARARSIGAGLPPFVTKVGVFVNATPAEVARTVRLAHLDAVQLHGEEDATKFLKCGAMVIKTAPLSTKRDVTRARRTPRMVTLLVDVRDPIRRGGTGRQANWALARRLAAARPILLAGGLTAANVAEAIRSVRPWGIDLSSGVEVSPGRKSARKIRTLFARVARADAEAS